MLRNYDFGNVTMVVAGRRLRGIVSVNPTRNEDSFTEQVGADGEVTRSKTNNRTGNFEIVMQQSSPDNSFLQNLINTDENTVAPFAAGCKDLSGTYTALGARSYIVKPADNGLERDAGERTWNIRTTNMEILGGGNPSV